MRIVLSFESCPPPVMKPSPATFALFFLTVGEAQEIERFRSPDIAYGDYEAQKLDLYLPASPEKAPVMVYVHGGGWSKGDKKAVAAKPAFFRELGWIFASVNYRLLPEGRHPENANDVAAAIAWVHENIAPLGGDPDRIFVMGHSAGAHLAALVATDERPLQRAGKSLAILKGVIALDTNAYDMPGLLRETSGALYSYVFGSDPETLKDASPLHHVKAGKSIPPFLICYSRGIGSRPQAMRPVAAAAFRDALADVGVAAHVVDASDRNHGEINAWFGKAGDEKVTGKAKTFLRAIAAGRDWPE